MSLPLSLLTSRRLGPLCLSQACGALNDNLVKNAMIVLAVFKLGTEATGLSALAGALFIAPYALLSATAGQLADRFDKSRMIRIVKAAEVVLMAGAAYGFLADSVPALLAVLFGLGVQATMFGPLKYGILPDHLDETEIVTGNGLIEAFTFLAILGGTVAGGGLALLAAGPAIVASAGLAISLLGLASAFAIPAAPAADRTLRIGWNVLRETVAVVRQAAANRPVRLSILGLSWFWAIGAALLSEFPSVVRDTLGANGQVVTLMLAVFSVGVGTGSMLCARLLRGEVSARLVPFAAFGLTVFLLDFGATAQGAAGQHLATVGGVLASPAGWHMLLDLLLLAVCGGLYSVPLYAILQERSDPSRRARMVAANNIVNALLMVAGAAVVAGLAAGGHVGPARAGTGRRGQSRGCAVDRAADAAVGAVGRCSNGTFAFSTRRGSRGWRILTAPAGARVVIVNHVSFMDGCFVAAFVPGNPVFAIDTEQARKFWFLRYVIDFCTVDPSNPMAARTMIKAVREGRRLVIFPEGRITVTGGLMKIYDGPGLIADKADAPVIPVRIEGLQFHKTSRMQGKFPLRWFPHVSLTVSAPRRIDLPAELVGRRRREALGRFVQDAMVDAAFQPERADRSLFAALLEARKLYDIRKPVVADFLPDDAGVTTLTQLGYGRLVLGSVVLGRKLAELTEPGEHVGVLLPNAVGTVVTVFALQSQARVPAMLNFAAGADSVLACCKAAGVRTVLTSRRAVLRGKLDALVAALSSQVQIVYLEDVRTSIGLWDKLSGKLASPARLPGARVRGDAAALVLFTSGSEGTPKGVVHSHRGLLANCAQVKAVIDFNPADRVLNALPMFHAFGMTGGVLLPLLHGVRTFLYPSPLHYRMVPEMIYWDQSTIMFGTDTFLSGYARRGHPVDLQSLRYIFAGAERLRPETRAAYMALFKKPVFEGYGVTETAPVLALNTYANSREGSVGRLLPGIEARVQPVPGIEDAGRLLVRGPNVMLGYLRHDAPGRAAAATGRLARHRRHRRDRRRRLRVDQGSGKKIREDRRRDGVAGGCGGPGQ